MISRLSGRLLHKYLGVWPRSREFIFCVGLSKTGTTSLDKALQLLGYSSFHLPPITRVVEGQVIFSPEWWVWRFDAWTDLSAAAVASDLFKAFPNARFIQTKRDRESWLESCARHFTLELAEARVRQGNHWILDLNLAFYGSIIFDRKLFGQAFDRHEDRIKGLLEGDARFLEIDVVSGDGWNPLCEFLGRDIPAEVFPFENRSKGGGRPPT